MDERIWTDRPIDTGEPLELGGCRAALETVPHLSLVSGDLDAALAALSRGSPILGLGETTEADEFAIRIARDHAAVVTANPPDLAPGWQEEGFGISRADDKFAALSTTGPSVEDVLAHGLSSALPRGSASAALRFAGRTILLTGLANGYRLWIERADLTYVTSFLKSIRIG